jgi:hypothetical protein
MPELAMAERPGPNLFVRRLVADLGLTAAEQDILRASGVASANDVHALIGSFPGLAALGLRIPLISNAVSRDAGPSYLAIAQQLEAIQPAASFGALPPAGARFSPGTAIDLQTALAAVMPAGGPPPGGGIDLRAGLIWPVRDQGHRGTCVAFGSTACAEFFYRPMPPLVDGPASALPDLSEQFLYFQIKTATADPHPNADGTWLRFARDALSAAGICLETLWPYVATAVAPVSGATPGQPTAPAVADAGTRVLMPVSYNAAPAPGAAATLLGLLRAGRPVAICLPVFGNPGQPNGVTNWTTPDGWAFGRVINPPPTTVVQGGHCVCVVGYQPDAQEPHGGYFIFRNSSNTAWAAQAPSPGYASPAPGYGDISASYVDQYCWELMQL